MKEIAQGLAFLLAVMGGPLAFRIWASRRYARRTGESVIAGIVWHWIFERIGGVPAGIWALLWFLVTSFGIVACLLLFWG